MRTRAFLSCGPRPRLLIFYSAVCLCPSLQKSSSKKLPSFQKFLKTSLHVICDLRPPSQKSSQRLCCSFRNQLGIINPDSATLSRGCFQSCLFPTKCVLLKIFSSLKHKNLSNDIKIRLGYQKWRS